MTQTRPDIPEAKGESALERIVSERTPSPILRTAARYMAPLLLMFSIFVLLRGHNEPGGGFIGGLVASAALALYALAYGADTAWRVFNVQPRALLGIGLFFALTAGLVPLATGQAFMTGVWSDFEIPVIGKLGTPLLFDIGVYLVVIGVMMMIVISLMEE